MDHDRRRPRALNRARALTAGAVLTAVVATGAISTELAMTHTASAVSSPSEPTTSSTTDTGPTGATGAQATTPPASGTGSAQHGTTSAS